MGWVDLQERKGKSQVDQKNFNRLVILSYTSWRSFLSWFPCIFSTLSTSNSHEIVLIQLFFFSALLNAQAFDLLFGVDYKWINWNLWLVKNAHLFIFRLLSISWHNYTVSFLNPLKRQLQSHELLDQEQTNRSCILTFDLSHTLVFFFQA